MSESWDVIVIGAGAAGLMCAQSAGYRGRRVLVLDNAKKAGRKVLISGGGRCNFTNFNVESSNFVCNNPHFVKSALSRFTQHDFLELIERHGVPFEEREHSQLFCLNSAQDIVDLLKTECDWAGVRIQLRTEILEVHKEENGFFLNTSQGEYRCESLVVATGGLSMPKLGATPYGYKLAEQFGLQVAPTRAGLVPFTLHTQDKARFEPLSGIAVKSYVQAEAGPGFKENILFTHRGLSGPAILQVSSYWLPGQSVTIDLLPGTDLEQALSGMAASHPKQALKTALSRLLPKRLIEVFDEQGELPNITLQQLNPKHMAAIKQQLHQWTIKPNGTEGYRTAEVTLGGVDTDELSSKTFEAKKVPGLYFVGEVMDVAGWLGGFNFQWAWSSGWCAGQYV